MEPQLSYPSIGVDVLGAGGEAEMPNCLSACVLLVVGLGVEVPAPVSLRPVPAAIEIDLPESTEQVLVFGKAADGREVDLTRQASYATTVPGIISTTPTGRITPLRDGATELIVMVGMQTARIPVQVRGVAAPPPIAFQRDIIPILTKAGCNSGGCHGKAEGQNGFKLSVFGYDAAADRQAIAFEGGGRRVFPPVPDQSLFLRKALAVVPHGGGKKFDAESRWHRRVRRWISEGMTLDDAAQVSMASIAVEPAHVTLTAFGSQQLRVTAVDSQGRFRCVTAEAEYQSNNDGIAGVDRDGLVAATDVPGEAAILVRYLGQVAVCRVTRPRAAGEFVRPPEHNFIDRLVWDKLQQLRVPPSPPADDATFLRRVYLDAIGTLPTVDEVRRFLADGTPDKRQALIAALLNRPEYVDYWTQRWCDLLQVDKDIITPQGAVAMSRWVRRQLEQNVPYNEFTRAVLTAKGSTLSESPAAFFQVQRDAETSARAVSQLFLGVRIECAQCHHHPFERWDQKDYFALAGFFTGVERKPGPQGGIKIVARAGADLKHPRTGEVVPTAGLGAAPAEFAGPGDRRHSLADWVTNPGNPLFSKTIANRLAAHYLGRGLVEPIDDLRATNPASNEPLLDALAAHVVASKFDLKAVTQTLLESRVYQLSSVVNEGNALDEQNYSHALWKPIAAEVLLDAMSQATLAPEEFNGWPAGYRAIQVWDNKLPSDFLQIFGRPTRQTVCACERGVEPSIAQALHLMNSTTTLRKIQERTGRARRLAESTLAPAEIVTELYLATLSRPPTADEQKLMEQAFTTSSDRRAATEDVLWTLLNTKEFVFNH